MIKMDINSGSKHRQQEKTIGEKTFRNNTCSKQDDYDNLADACECLTLPMDSIHKQKDRVMQQTLS